MSEKKNLCHRERERERERENLRFVETSLGERETELVCVGGSKKVRLREKLKIR